MNKDAITTLRNAGQILSNMGFSQEEISKYLFDGGKKAGLQAGDAVDIMTLYVRAKKLLSDKHVQDIISRNANLKGSAGISRDVDALLAIESFVDTLDHTLVLSNVGSGKKEHIRTWEEYFKAKENEYEKALKDSGKSTRRQRDTYSDIKDNPYDERVKSYLKTYLTEQTKNDIVYAVNTDEKAILTVKGLPFAVGKSKQESYADVVLKYLYADSQISKYQTENTQLKQLNKSLKEKLQIAGQSSQINVSKIENVIVAAMAKSNDSLSQTLNDYGQRVVEQLKKVGLSVDEMGENINNARDVLLASNDDVREDLKGTVITNGRARKAEHEMIISKIDALIKELSLKENENDAFNADIISTLNSLRVYMANNVVSKNELKETQRFLASIEINNGRARNAEYETLFRVISNIDKNVLDIKNSDSNKNKKKSIKGVVAGAVAGALVTAGILVPTMTGFISSAKKSAYASNAELDKYRAYAIAEQAELDDFNKLLADLAENGYTDEEIGQLLSKIDEYSKTDNSALGMSSTGAMRAKLDSAVSLQSLSLVTEKYNKVLAEYEALKNSQSSNAYDYISLLSNMVAVSEQLALSLEDNSLSATEIAAINGQLAALAQTEDSFAKEIATRFGVSIENIMNSLEYQVASLSNEIASLSNEITALKNQSQVSANTIAQKESKIQSLEAQVEALKKQLSNTGSDASLKAELAQAQADLAQAKAELSQTKSDLAQANSDIASANNKINDLTNKNNSLSSEISGLKDNILSLNQQINSLKTENSSLKSSNDALSGEIAGYISEVANLNNKYDQLVANYNAKVQEYNALLEKYNALANSGSADTSKIAQLEAELQQKAQELAEANSQISQLNSAIDKLERQVSDLTNQISDNDASFLKDLYEKLSGKSASGKSIAEIKTYLADAFDISESNQNSSAAGDEGYAPER